MRQMERRGGKAVLPVVVLLPILAVGLVVGLFLIPKGGISWTFWGFEKHSFTVGDEYISLRLDTSGVGPYEVNLRDGNVEILRCGAVLWEGGFAPVEDWDIFAEDVLAAEGCRVLEHIMEEPASLVCSDPDGGGYVLMAKMDGSEFGAVFHMPEGGGRTDQEVLECAHRLQFEKVD